MRSPPAWCLQRTRVIGDWDDTTHRECPLRHRAVGTNQLTYECTTRDVQTIMWEALQRGANWDDTTCRECPLKLTRARMQMEPYGWYLTLGVLPSWLCHLKETRLHNYRVRVGKKSHSILKLLYVFLLSPGLLTWSYLRRGTALVSRFVVVNLFIWRLRLKDIWTSWISTSNDYK